MSNFVNLFELIGVAIIS